MKPAHPRRQGGLGLLEVLVALVVVSFGVLGMAGLQLTGMKHSSGGFNRAKALLLAENMATRMRINAADGLPAAGYDAFDSATTPAMCAAKPAPYCQRSDATPADACSAEQLADFDTWSISCGDWGGGEAGSPIGEALPGGRLRVDCDVDPCLADSTWTIDVEWQEGSTTSDDPDRIDTRSVRMRLRP